MIYTLGYTSREKQIVQGWAEWLDSIYWTSFCTFTTHYRLTVKTARRKMEKMTTNLIDKYGSNFRIFWIIEPNADKSGSHVHALIKIDEAEISHKQSLTEAWHLVSYPSGNKKHNLVNIQDYEPSRGGHYYVAKHIQRRNVDYGMY